MSKATDSAAKIEPVIAPYLEEWKASAEEALTDLLTDIRHWAEVHNVAPGTFETAVRYSATHCEDESKPTFGGWLYLKQMEETS